MSYVEVFRVDKDGDVVSYDTARNNHGFAPLVWEKLGEKYEVPRTNEYYLMMDKPALEATWKLRGEGKLDRLDNVLMGATFDRVWVKREDVPLLVEACRRFNRDHIAGAKLVDTVDRTADLLEMMFKEFSDDLGVAFNMCSANGAFWHVRVPCSECGCTCNGDTRPYNVKTDDEQPDGEYYGESAWVLEVPS